ncbi:hypothetical protein F5X99DRAFT_384417 [Biscogniauxia marginata]|nr:hypothetical protein F5X99DRAFT_384417 [Biscogniauxia marginata]
MDLQQETAEATFPVNEALLQRYGLSEREWKIFRDFEKKQEDFHEWLTKSKKLAKDETRAIGCRSCDDAKKWTEEAERLHSTFEDQHSRGPRKWVRKYQSLAAGVSSFLDDISPLLDVVKGLGPPYSGIAVGTICGLFTIASRKNAMEAQAWSIIEGVKDRLPGYRMYNEIYNEESEMQRDLRKKIIFAYMAFIDMNMEISKYYLQTGAKRWGRSIFKSTKFQDMSDEVNEKISAIRLRCEELQSLSISKLRESNEELKGKVDDLERKLDAQERDQASSHLIEFQELLGLPDWTPGSHRLDLEHYLQHLNSERNTESIFEQMRTGSIERFRREPEFVEWEQPGQSAVLLLIGANNSAIADGKKHCWVSPFALDLDARLSRNASAPHATYVFPPPSANTSVYTALPIVLVQLLTILKSKLAAGDEKRGALSAAVKAYAALEAPQDDDEDFYGGEKVTALGVLTTQVFRMFEAGETVYVILDRVDQCLERDQYDLMEILKDLLLQVECVVKILMVADRVSWQVAQNAVKLPSSVFKQKVMRQEYLMGLFSSY